MRRRANPLETRMNRIDGFKESNCSTCLQTWIICLDVKAAIESFRESFLLPLQPTANMIKSCKGPTLEMHLH